MSSNSKYKLIIILFLTCFYFGCQCPSDLRTCRTDRDQLAIQLSQCQAALGQCQANGPSVASVAGILHYMANYKIERLAAGDVIHIEQCTLSANEFELLQSFETADGTQTSHFLELRDWDGDGIGDGIFLMTNPKSGNVQSGQVTMELDGVPASYDVRQSCRDLAIALNLCGS